MKLLTISFFACLLSTPVLAQQSRPAPRPEAKPADAIAKAQESTASFADWTLRCLRISDADQQCEIIQRLEAGNGIVAHVALGRVGIGKGLRFTLVVMPNVEFRSGVQLTGSEQFSLELTWQRCISLGCFADATLNEAIVERLIHKTGSNRLTFTDGSGSVVGFPLSSNGLAVALDALRQKTE